ncbi:hypothetical protein JG687_00003097 [Phytophthora cactorum]|uniref:Uncharacterized protein n=1 Tax=Phytophthora cactorum TaxID=29920 RepID=A0A8T1UX66_9STRA|nr:hypothetical protein PC120_g4631 [Phytophthora cactorum]KAG6969608.1 hypothetical protein JG687_00003097 [Phytophthora cactorum]
MPTPTGHPALKTRRRATALKPVLSWQPRYGPCKSRLEDSEQYRLSCNAQRLERVVAVKTVVQAERRVKFTTNFYPGQLSFLTVPMWLAW